MLARLQTAVFPSITSFSTIKIFLLSMLSSAVTFFASFVMPLSTFNKSLSSKTSIDPSSKIIFVL